MSVQFNSSNDESISSHLLDELAHVYARAAARAYFDQMMRESQGGGGPTCERERLKYGAKLAA